MECAYHSGRETDQICSCCLRPICEECRADLGNAAIRLCFSCAYGPVPTRAQANILAAWISRHRMLLVVSLLALAAGISVLLYLMQSQGGTVADILLNHKAEVYFTIHPPQEFEGKQLSIHFSDGRTNHAFSMTDFAPLRDESGASARITNPVRTRLAGKLLVDVLLADRDTGELLTSGSFQIPLHSDWYWDVHLVIAKEDPFIGCMGCSEQLEFPFNAGGQPSNSDADGAKPSLYIVWGGNSFHHPVVY